MKPVSTAVTIVLEAYPMEWVNAWAEELMQAHQWRNRHRDEVVSYVLNQAVLLASRTPQPAPGADPPAD